ncbi:MAG: adenine deaminase [Thermomicrobiaceae bacterium]
MVEQWRRFLSAAKGESPGDLVIRNGRLVNVASNEIEEVDVLIVDGKIAGVGDYPEADRVLDAGGAYLAPSFIDGHVHVESSLLWMDQFAKAVVPCGTGAVVTDPHEIANVAGLAGIRALMDASDNLPVSLFFTIPSCVPASPFETAGAEMTAEAIAEGLALPRVVGLGEMMNFPGVLSGDESIFKRLQLEAPRRDGHAPGVRGKNINAYAGSGMTSDHESTELEEAREKLRRGLMIMIREGSTEHNLVDLLPLVTDDTYPRCCFASDDRDCATLMHDGHIDAVIRKAVANGLDPIRAIRMATLHTAEYWRLNNHGMIAPGYQANIVLFERLDDIRPATVLYQGEVVAENGAPLFDTTAQVPPELLDSVRIQPLTGRSLDLAAEPVMQAMEAIPGQIVTRRIEVEPKTDGGLAVVDLEHDLLKIATVERHNATGNIGIGLIRGFGLKQGALATSIAHDAHNIVCIGTNDADMRLAIETVVEMQGGLAAVDGGAVAGQLALPVAGILSDRPLDEVTEAYEHIEEIARSFGSTVPSPFGLLSFMALSVIPEARVTDQGFISL